MRQAPPAQQAARARIADDGVRAQWLDGTVLPDGNWVLKGVALTRLSTVLNALVMAGLVWAGALSFKRVVRSDSAQLVYCMQARPACTRQPFFWLVSRLQVVHDLIGLARHSCWSKDAFAGGRGAWIQD